MKFVDFVYSPASIKKYGTLIKQPVPRYDNVLPAENTLTAEMIEDFTKYGSFTITDQGLPQEVAAFLFEAQDSVATGIMTPKQAAEFMAKSTDDYYKSK